jgi:hypothetical protein
LRFSKGQFFRMGVYRTAASRIFLVPVEPGG